MPASWSSVVKRGTSLPQCQEFSLADVSHEFPSLPRSGNASRRSKSSSRRRAAYRDCNVDSVAHRVAPPIDGQCAICLEPLRSDLCGALRICKHQFHWRCLQASMDRGTPAMQCAVCRAPFIPALTGLVDSLDSGTLPVARPGDAEMAGHHRGAGMIGTKDECKVGSSASLGGQLAGAETCKSSAGLETPGQASRTRTLVSVFQMLCSGVNSHLGQKEMERFARMTGFNANESEWAGEYQLLCRDWDINPLVGFSVEAFKTLVNDKSRRGCYCSDEELQHVVGRLRPDTAGVVDVSTKLPQQDWLPKEPLHQACSANTLSARKAPSELGFWELNSPEKEPGQTTTQTASGLDHGVKQETPRAPVDSRNSLESQAKTPVRKAAKSPEETVASHRPGRSRKQTRPPRARVIESLFEALDCDHDGFLSSSELRVFCELFGFEGSAAEWRLEYDSLCGDWRCSSAGGISRAVFAALVSDTSKAGCFCDDHTLRGIHEAAGGRLLAGSAEVRTHHAAPLAEAGQSARPRAGALCDPAPATPNSRRPLPRTPPPDAGRRSARATAAETAMAQSRCTAGAMEQARRAGQSGHTRHAEGAAASGQGSPGHTPRQRTSARSRSQSGGAEAIGAGPGQVPAGRALQAAGAERAGRANGSGHARHAEGAAARSRSPGHTPRQRASTPPRAAAKSPAHAPPQRASTPSRCQSAAAAELVNHHVDAAKRAIALPPSDPEAAELFINTCSKCGETHLLAVEIGEHFACRDVGKPCTHVEEEIEALSIMNLSLLHDEAYEDLRYKLLRQISHEGLTALEAAEFMLNHGCEPPTAAELANVRKVAREHTSGRVAATACAGGSARKKNQRYLDGQLVEVPKGSKHLVAEKETPEQRRKTSCSIRVLGSSARARSSSVKKKGPSSSSKKP